MRTVRFELLRPDEIIEERKRFPVVYFPLGPLEWHSRHLPLGTDPLNAEAVARAAAQKTGGVVLPTFFWGSEMERSEQMLKNIGFKGDEWVVGMDFPANSIPSLYIPEDAFSIGVRAYLNLLVAQGYKLIVIVNGHGGENHMRVLENLAREFTATRGCKVICTLGTTIRDEEDVKEDAAGHATKNETSILSYLYPDSVDLSVLPPKGQPIYNVKWAIVDGASFDGNPNKDFTAEEDPRDATAERGKELVEDYVRRVVKAVGKAVKDIK